MNGSYTWRSILRWVWGWNACFHGISLFYARRCCHYYWSTNRRTVLSFSLTPRLGHFVITALQMTDLVVCKAIKAKLLRRNWRSIVFCVAKKFTWTNPFIGNLLIAGSIEVSELTVPVIEALVALSRMWYMRCWNWETKEYDEKEMLWVWFHWISQHQGKGEYANAIENDILFRKKSTGGV